MTPGFARPGHGKREVLPQFGFLVTEVYIPIRLIPVPEFLRSPLGVTSPESARVTHLPVVHSQSGTIRQILRASKGTQICCPVSLNASSGISARAADALPGQDLPENAQEEKL